jgi:hypothetical protein
VRKRNVIPADQMLKLVLLELRVRTPDSLLRAHNLAHRCCDSIEALLQKYDAITAGPTGWFSRKAASQEQVQKVQFPSFFVLFFSSLVCFLPNLFPANLT